MINKHFSYKLNLLRALAALFVMLGHVRGAYFVQYSDLIPEYQNVVVFLFYAITRIGHQFVIVFFVLSGFLVGGLSLNSHKNGTLSLKKYFIKRLSRMWVVLIPTLILGGTLNYFSGFTNNLSSSIFIGNLTFLQTVFFPVYGNNGPLWSLAYEFWYYIIFMIILLILRRAISKSYKFLLLFILISITTYIMPHVLMLFPIWLMGVIIPFVPARKILKNKYFKFITKACFLPMMLLANYFSEYILSDILLGLYITIFLIILKLSFKGIKEFKFINVLSNMSFSLYAIHYPLLIFGISIFEFKRIDFLSVANIFSFMLLNVFLILLSYFFYFLFERNTYKISSIFMQKL